MKSELRFVGFVLVVLGVGGLLGIYLANWLGNRLQLTFWGPEIGSFLRSLLIFPLVFSQVTGMLALVSVWNLRQCRGYTLALTAIALSWLQPFLWPLTLPLGIRAWTVLRRSNVRAAFLARKDRVQRDGGSRVDVRDAYRLAVASAVLGLSSFLFLPFHHLDIAEVFAGLKITWFIIAVMQWIPHYSAAVVLGVVALVIMRDLAGQAKGMGWATFGVLYPSLFLILHRLGSSLKPQEDSARLEQLLLTALTAAFISALLASWGARRLAHAIRAGSETAVRRFMNRWIGMTGLVFLVYAGFMLFPEQIRLGEYAPISRRANDFIYQHKHQESQAAAEAKGLAAQTGFGTVELRAIAEPAAAATCWLPDGTPRCQQTTSPSRNTEPRTRTRELLFYLGGNDIQGTLNQLHIECFTLLSGRTKACPHGLLVGFNSNPAMIVNVPSESQVADLRVGLPDKVWEETEASWTWTGDWRRLKKKSIRRQGLDWEIRLQSIQDSPTAMSVSFTHNAKRDWGARLVAVDQEGVVHEPDHRLELHTFAPDSETVSYNHASFPGLKQARLRELRFQVRSYHWVEFQNISLRPGQRTQVEVKESGAPASDTPRPTTPTNP